MSPNRTDRQQMSASDDELRFQRARDTILEAGRLAMSYRTSPATEEAGLAERLGVTEKLNGQDVVSIADRAVEDLIRGQLLAAFPQDGFMGEESAPDEGASGHVWVVDPIDGTSCYVHGLDDWCVSIALNRDGRTVLGLIYSPVRQELFTARLGGGAFLNDRPIHVDAQAALENCLFGLGASLRVTPETVTDFTGGLLRGGGMFYRNGSGALMLAYVAAGRLGGYYEPHINAWDCLAGLCLIREAGGWTQDFPGAGNGLRDGGPVLATAPQMREAVLALLHGRG